MIVRLAPSVFRRNASSSFELIDIVHLCAQGRHALVLESEAAARVDRWLYGFEEGELREALRERIDLARRQGSRIAALGRARAELTVHDEGDEWSDEVPRLSLESAWHYLHLPLRVIVENLRSDGAFLRAMLHGDDGTALRRAMDDGRIELTHGGGSDLVPYAESLKDDPRKRLRSVLVFDQDGVRPSEPGQQAKLLRERCVEGGVAHHPLERRAIENYIPIGALRRHIDLQTLNVRDAFRDRVEALATLARKRPDLRNHLPMKDGFRGEVYTWPAPFDEVPVELRAPLHGGFGTHIAREVFDCPEAPIREKWIRDDGSAPEMARLANLLIQRL